MAMLPYNLGYSGQGATNRLNSGPGSSYQESAAPSRYNNDPETIRFNTNSLTVTNPLHSDHRHNLNTSPHTTASTAFNNSPVAATNIDDRNTFYENSADDEHTNDDNDAVTHNASQTLYPGSRQDVRPRTNSLFDRYSWYNAGEGNHDDEAVAAAIAEAKRKLSAKYGKPNPRREEKVAYMDGIESSSDTSYSHAAYSLTSEASSDSLSNQIEPPPVPPKLWAKLDTDGQVVSATSSVNNNDTSRDRYATIRSTAVWTAGSVSSTYKSPVLYM